MTDPQSPAWTRLQGLFHGALELGPEERAEFVARIESVDPGMAREVRSLLAAHEASSSFLDAPAESPFGKPLAAGDHIGPYRIVEPIGHGGMGVVYRATRDDETFTKDVAIKLIHPGMRSEDILKRFRSERQILALLEHPNIARLIDGGSTPDGAPYLVMEFVAGTPLLAYCEEKHLGVDDRLALFLEVCDAVEFAHQRLVVHRDLKSDNILVAADGTPRLLDFGIAKVLAPGDGTPVGTVTAPMRRILTPDYASPEQVRGEPATLACDVYSLGVVLYELLTGARPYHFTTRTPEEILRVVTQEDAALPSTAADRTLKRRLAGDLDFIVLKALEKDAARRYSSVAQLAQDIRRHLEGQPVTARRGTTAYLVSRFVRRHRAAVVTTALVLVALVVGLAGTAWQAHVASQERDLANRRFDDVKQMAHTVLFDIHDAIASLPGSTKARELIVENGLTYLDRLGKEAKGDLGLQQEIAIAYSKIGDVQGRAMFPNLGRTADAKKSYEKALAMLDDVSRGWPDSTSVTHNWIVVSQRLADLLRVMGQPKEALAVSVRTKERVAKELLKHPNEEMFMTDMSVATNRLVDMRLEAADTLGALAESRTNVNIAETYFRKAPQDAGWRRGALIACAKLANLHAIRGDRDSALVLYLRGEKLAEEARAALPNDTDAARDLSIVYGMHGLFLVDGGDLDGGLAVYDKGMKIAEDLAAADPSNMLQKSDLADGYYEIGSMLMKGKRYAESARNSEEAYGRYAAIAAADTGNGGSRVSMARAARQVSEAWQAMAQRGKALEWARTSRDLYRSLAKAGALSGEEAGAPQELERIVASLGS